MQTIPFVKMHGCGNDYLFVDCLQHEYTLQRRQIAAMCNRHFGVGGDGVVLMLPHARADARMRMFNADGSEGKMCGNAIRCMAWYLYDRGIARKPDLTIDTLAGVRHIHVHSRHAADLSVDMGNVHLEDLPCVQVGNDRWQGQGVDVGSRHWVCFQRDLSTLPLATLGSAIVQQLDVNVEFVQVVNATTLRMLVYERGSGETLACGTGATAAAFAAVQAGLCLPQKPISVQMKGGALQITVRDTQIEMRGTVAEVCRGEWLLQAQQPHQGEGV